MAGHMAEHAEGMKVIEGMKGTVLKRQDMRLLIQGIDFDFRINVPEVAVFAMTAGGTEAGNACASLGKQKSKKPKAVKGTKEGWKDIHKHQSNRATLPTELLVGLAVMLWTMSQSGVPMT